MSGALRKLLGPTKSLLIDYLSEASEETRPSTPKSVSSEDLKEKLYNAKYLLDRLQKTVALIEQINEKWTNYIAGLPKEDLPAEEKLYSEFFEGDSGAIKLLLDAKERISYLEVLIAELSQLIPASPPPDDQQETAVKTVASAVTINPQGPSVGFFQFQPQTVPSAMLQTGFSSIPSQYGAPFSVDLLHLKF